MKAVIQAVFPWKATGLGKCSGKKNDRIIHNSVPNSKQRQKPCLFEGLIRQGQTGYSIWRMTKGSFQEKHRSHEGL